MHELIEAADALRNTGTMLDDYASLTSDADAEELRRTALGVHASAMQALASATAALKLSERFATLGFVREHDQEESDDEE